jgi:hypothetical protein
MDALIQLLDGLPSTIGANALDVESLGPSESSAQTSGPASPLSALLALATVFGGAHALDTWGAPSVSPSAATDILRSVPPLQPARRRSAR